MLLADYALIPDIFFDVAQYGSPELRDEKLKYLYRIFSESCLIRDLHNGNWFRSVRDCVAPNKYVISHLLKSLKTERRFYPFRPMHVEVPDTDLKWCAEAIDSHKETELTGIISGKDIKARYPAAEEIGSIHELDRKAWWIGGKSSVRILPKIEEYNKSLDLVLRHSNSLKFADYFLSPRSGNYHRDFLKVLEVCLVHNVKPAIQIHRVFQDEKKNELPNAVWESMFREWLRPFAVKHGFNIKVFLWDRLHDRFLISDLCVVSMGQGFSTSNDPAAPLTTLTRLDLVAAEDVRREFLPQYNRHILKHSFDIV